MKIALSTDHAGFAAVGDLQNYIESLGHQVHYVGPEQYNSEDDYPELIASAARLVASGDSELGIILGGSGQGEAMAANRFKGVRAAVFYGPVVAKIAVDAEGNSSDDPYEIVKLSRQHNHANVLSLAGRFLSKDEMFEAIRIWLETPVSPIERHQRRTIQLDEIN